MNRTSLLVSAFSLALWLVPSSATAGYTCYAPASGGFPNYDTIQEAVDDFAAGFYVCDTIVVPSSGSSYEIAATITIDREVTIAGEVLPAASILDAIDIESGPLFMITSPGDVTLKDLTITNNSFNDEGAIQAFGVSLSLDDVAFEFNHSTSVLGGGCLYAYDSIISATNVDFNYGGSVESGGAVHSAGGTAFTCSDCEFESNYSYGEGGGVFVDDGNLVMDNSVISSNIAYSGHGGGVYVEGADTVVVEGSTFEYNNTHTGFGGGLAVRSVDSLEVEDSIFNDNSADSRGGGLWTLYVDEVTSTKNTFIDGYAGYGGGGAWVDGDEVLFDTNTFSNNHSSEFGGGLVVFSGTYGTTRYLDVYNTTFDGNSADQHAGGLWVRGSYQTVIENSTFSENVSGSAGGVYLDSYVDPIDAAIRQTTFYNNSTTYNGSAILTETGVLTLEQSVISDGVGSTDLCRIYTGGSIVSSGYNRDTDGTCFLLPKLTDVVNTSVSSVALKPLQNNGGDVETHKPSPASTLLVDQVPASTCQAVSDLDQRGYSRPVNRGGGPLCDVGSVEVQ